MTETQI